MRPRARARLFRKISAQNKSDVTSSSVAPFPCLILIHHAFEVCVLTCLPPCSLARIAPPLLPGLCKLSSHRTFRHRWKALQHCAVTGCVPLLDFAQPHRTLPWPCLLIHHCTDALRSPSCSCSCLSFRPLPEPLFFGLSYHTTVLNPLASY